MRDCIGVGIEWRAQPVLIAWPGHDYPPSCQSTLPAWKRADLILNEELPSSIADAVATIDAHLRELTAVDPLCQVPRISYEPTSRYGDVVRLMAVVEAHGPVHRFEVDERRIAGLYKMKSHRAAPPELPSWLGPRDSEWLLWSAMK
jgi:hypothetical protein